MFLEGKGDNQKSNMVVLTITGNIDLKQVSKLADDLNIPGGNELKNIKNK